MSHDLLGGHLGLVDVAANGVKPVETRLDVDLLLVAGILEAVVSDLDLKVFCYLLLVDHLADFDANLRLPSQRITFAISLCLDLCKQLFRRPQQGFSLSLAFVGQEWVATHNQSFVGIVGMRDAYQIALVEERTLNGALLLYLKGFLDEVNRRISPATTDSRLTGSTRPISSFRSVSQLPERNSSGR